MSNTTLLIKCVTLLCREQKLLEDTEEKDYSTDLIGTVITMLGSENKQLLGTDTEVNASLVSLLVSMINDMESYDTETVIETLTIVLKDNETLFNNIKTNLTKELTSSGLKSTVVKTRRQLSNYYREKEIIKKFSKASYELNTGLVKSGFADYIKSIITEVEALNNTTSGTSPGIVSEIDISSKEDSKAFDLIQSNALGTSKIKTGFWELNNMLCGGPKLGDMGMINALPHSYKSGLTQTLFCQFPIYNKPEQLLFDKNKKPLFVYISAEDDPEVYIKFVYEYLYSVENNKMPDLTKVTSDEMREYLNEKLTVNGFHVKMVRINPAEWSYKDLFNYVLNLEADGYQIIAMLFDYLVKLPPTGCIGKGGVEYRDLYDRIRQFFSAKKITFITPHQMSTEAKQLVRNGESPLTLVKKVAERGYTELSKQLDQVVDFELNIHKAHRNRKPVLTIMRGKYRGAPIIDDDDKYCILDFPYKAPIKPTMTVDGERIKDGEVQAEEISDEAFFG